MGRTYFQGITRNIVLLGLVSFFTDLGSQMIFPLLPLYLTAVLGAGAAMVGLVEGAAESMASLLKVVSGYWSDKMKTRKPFVLLGYGISALAKPLFAVAGSALGVFMIRIIERIGKGIRNAPRDAIVAESVQYGQRGSAFGFQRAFDGLGSIGGALLAFLLLPLWGYKKIFLLAAVPGFLAVLAILLIREKTGTSNTYQPKTRFRSSFSSLPGNLRLFVVAAGIFAFGHFGYAFLLLKGKNLGMDDQQVILWYILFYGIYTITSYPLGKLSDQWGRRPMLLLGYGLFGLLVFALLFTTHKIGLLWIFGFYGLALAFIDTAQRAFTVDLCPSHLKATALGYLHMAIGIAALPGGYFAGWLWDQWGPEATFILAAFTTLAALYMVFRVHQKNLNAP